MSATNRVRMICKMLLFGATEVLCSYAVIWSGYSMEYTVTGGYFTRHEAMFWTFQMAIVTAMLIFLAIALSFSLLRARRQIYGAVADLFAVGLALASYTALNFFWRNSWNGDLTKPAFLPLWNDVNSHFFYEWNWLTYLLFVSPIMAVLSTFLSFLLFRYKRVINPPHNATLTTFPEQP